MCGINGVVSLQPILEPRRIIQQMNRLVHHRGPDDNGTWVASSQNLAMGMQRLTIVDINTGYQPMLIDNLALVFNGEIYNYQYLKKFLQSKGLSFVTESDTEVIIQGFKYWGIAVCQHLEGMFAFSLYDQNTKQLYLARDINGEKPLYYTIGKQCCIWASELKSLKYAYQELLGELPPINPEALYLYFSLTFIPAPFSIYQSIAKLEPAHYLQLDTTLMQYKKVAYWAFSSAVAHDLTYIQAQKQIQTLVTESITQQLQADVPLGVYLSGGVDSSIVASIAQANRPHKASIKTFSVGFENPHFDESKRAQQVANYLGTQHHCFVLTYRQLAEEIEEVILHFDEPFADSSALPSYFLAKNTRQYVKVALTGDGADEVFGGYNRYAMPYYGAKYRQIISSEKYHRRLKSFLSQLPFRGKLHRFLEAVGGSSQEDILQVGTLGFSPLVLSSILKSNWHIPSLFLSQQLSEYSPYSVLQQARYWDKSIVLEGDMLTKVDRTSMMASLECRSPFLAKSLWEFTHQLPDDYLIYQGKHKRILKETFADRLPLGFFNLPKHGFEVPVGQWLSHELQPELLRLTSMDFLLNQAIFDALPLQNAIRSMLHYPGYYSFKLWSLFCFQKWYEKNY